MQQPEKVFFNYGILPWLPLPFEMIPFLRDNAPHHKKSQRLWGVFLKCLFAQIGKAMNAGVVRSMRKSKANVAQRPGFCGETF